MKNSLKWTREEASRLHRVRWAIMILTNCLAPEIRQRNLPEELEIIETTTSKRRLQEYIAALNREIRTLRERYKVHGSDDELLLFLSNAESGPKQQIAFVPVDFISENLCTLYDNLPAHCRIGIDLYGLRPDHSIFEIRLLEATLFEDMCSLFNLAKAEDAALQGRSGPKQQLKAANALLRATASAAFFFVEAYLNGIAYDHAARSWDSLSAKDRELLTETDQNGRARQVSTREKISQYPRIITNATHPPLQESNCRELKVIVEMAKNIRDSLVHGSPFPRRVGRSAATGSSKEDWIDKEAALFELTLTLVEQIVDASIGLVRKINELVGAPERVDWLKDRDQTGYFPKSAFD